MQTLPKERRFETLSYLPPLSDAQIAKQVQYILDQGFIPAVEFSEDSRPRTTLLDTVEASSVQGSLCSRSYGGS